MADEMRAIRVAGYGSADVLELRAVERPDPGPGEVLVEVEAAGVNFIDVYHREGLYPLDLPFTPGVEGGGKVVALGADVEAIDVGDDVAWAGPRGSYAQYAVVPSQRAVRVPDRVPVSVAAAVMLQGLTAHYLSHDTFPVSEGDVCLVHAGAGGVGGLLTQMAKIRGATVFTTVSTDEKAEAARGAGADHVIITTETDFADEIEAVGGERPLDVVYDGVGADTIDAGLALLRPRGVMVAYGNASGRPRPIDLLDDLMAGGSLFVTRPTLADYVATRQELAGRASALFDWIAAGDLDVHVGNRLPLAEAAQAHRMLEGRATIGKVLLEP